MVGVSRLSLACMRDHGIDKRKKEGSRLGGTARDGDMLTRSTLLMTLTLGTVAALSRDPSQVPLSSGSRPNIVFFLTDDQDVHLDSLAYQPFVQRHLIDQGLAFKRHFCTVALCCPSRVNLWTGRAAHNTNVTDINPPYGNQSSGPTTLGISQLIPLNRWISQICQPGSQ